MPFCSWEHDCSRRDLWLTVTKRNKKKKSLLCAWCTQSPGNNRYISFQFKPFSFSPHLIHIDFTFSVIWLQTLPFSEAVTLLHNIYILLLYRWVSLTITSTSEKAFFLSCTHDFSSVSFVRDTTNDTNACCAVFTPGNLQAILSTAWLG